MIYKTDGSWFSEFGINYGIIQVDQLELSSGSQGDMLSVFLSKVLFFFSYLQPQHWLSENLMKLEQEKQVNSWQAINRTLFPASRRGSGSIRSVWVWCRSFPGAIRLKRFSGFHYDFGESSGFLPDDLSW